MPLQSLNLRAAIFRCLNELKKSEVLGKGVIIRKTMFDDCKGEKLQELLASFSTIVLRKVLADGPGGKASIAGRLAIAKRVTSNEIESFLPLAIAHRASLTALLRRKETLRIRYKDFQAALDVKEWELDRRFEAIIETQGFLDEKVIPDHTVSRISKLLEKNWQGDARLVDVIAQGEEQQKRDSLLDEPFLETWSKVSSGEIDGPTTLTSHGLLADLEKRVASQETRLNQWKSFKDAMEKDARPTATLKLSSPSMTRLKANTPDLQKQRDLVFSPRKSPRKSGYEIEEAAERGSPSITGPKNVSNNQSPILNAKITVPSNNKPGSKKASVSQRKGSNLSLSLSDASSEDSDQSGFSEISNSHLRYEKEPKGERIVENVDTTKASNKDERDVHDSSSSPAPCRDEAKDYHEIVGPEGRDDDGLLAEQIISMTLNAAPTPAKPKPSLAERTRRSILTSASPGGLQRLGEDSPPPAPSLSPITEAPPEAFIQASAAATLLERTRQSISRVPSQPKISRKSINDRRNSKIYPTNQFETPRKQMSQIQEFTPPDELFSPGAGYDSVFKSRPKVGFSPVGSPIPYADLDHENDEGIDAVREMNEGWEDSPLARVGARV